ncbi:MAG: pantetheine-phosphate adenylyltransferase [Planctomycetes bacterium]|nr:pantetheine-phosphate adenylyltransferase [Planctomycetota bacterium]
MSQERIALFPGSFDPVTRGHLDVIRRAARLFDRLCVGVIANPEKVSCFSAEERVELLRGETADLENVEIRAFGGLTAALAAEIGALWIVRAVRSSGDAAFELPMAWSNRRSTKADVDTLLLPASSDAAFISSRLVRQIAEGGGELGAFVTPAVEAALRRRFPGAGGSRPGAAQRPRGE